MPPTRQDVHINEALTNISVAYIQSETAFIADKVFPLVPVKKQSDRYFKYNKEDWMRSQAEVRAPGTESAGGGFSIDNTPTYFCSVIAFHKDIDDQTRQNQSEPIDLDRDATAFVTRQLLLKRELMWQSAFFTTGVWSEDYTPTTLWSASGSTPIDDVERKRDQVEKTTGFRPNVLVVSPDVHTVLKNHSTILERIKYTQRGVVTADLLANLFELDRYLVAKAVVDLSAPGATPAPSFLYSKDALLVYAANEPSIMQPSGGYIFTWDGLLGAGAYGNRIKKFRIEQLSSDRVEGEMAFDARVVAADCGVFFNNVIS